MPISVITNFQVNANQPIDTRLVATSSSSLNNMQYKYTGLTVYRTDTNLNYTWNGSNWVVSSNGIYGGSGSLAANTYVDFGSLGDTSGNKTNEFVFSASSSNDRADYNTSFVRNFTGTGYEYVEYKSQLIFRDNILGTLNGPYISLNPYDGLNSKVGGIAFGTGDTTNDVVSERFRIEGNGIIRFKPDSTATSFMNIGKNSTNLPFLGFNWDGVERDDNSRAASFIEFNSGNISINNFNGVSVTHSAIFTRDSIFINGGLQISGGTLSTARNITFGSLDSSAYRVSSSNNFGILYDSAPTRNYAALISTGASVNVPRQHLRWTTVGNDGLITVLSPMVFTSSTTNVNIFASTIRSEYKAQMWDNVFNPDYGANVAAKDADTYSDLAFSRTTTSGENVKFDSDDGETANAGMIFVKPVGFAQGFPSDVVKTTGEFVIMIGQGYASSTTSESDVSKNTFSVDARDYDRIYYFYLDGYRKQIPHQVRWWLGEPGATTNWIQIGNIETGNKNNINTGSLSYGSITDNASRFYSQTVFVPSGMAFKIQFRFHLTWSLATKTNDSNSPRVFINVIRSGKFRTLASVPPTTASPIVGNLGYPGSPAEVGAGGGGGG